MVRNKADKIWAFPVVASKNGEVWLVLHGNKFVAALQVDDDRGVAHGDDQQLARVPRVELNS